jgi:aspartate aminotransferase
MGLMETRLSKAVLGINPSPTEATSFLANQMKMDGIDIISFAQGEPDFDTPLNISREAARAIDEGYTRYTDVPGIREVREAVAEKFEKENGIRYRPSEVMVSNGGKQVLYLLFRTICDPGDEVIVPTPCNVSYEEQIKLSGAVPVFAPTKKENHFRLTRKDIEKFITPKTKAVLINSPNNPTGAVCEEKDLREITDLAVTHDIFIVTDEVYEHLLYDGRKHVSIAAFGEDARRNTVTVNSASKTYAMTGWRIGYAGGPEDVISGMTTLQGHVSGNVCSVSQKALLEALRGPQDAVSEMRDSYAKRRDLMVEKINSIPGLSCIRPDGAFYCFADIEGLYGKQWREGTLKNDMDAAAFFLKEAHVAVVPGTGFRWGGYVRFVFANSEEDIVKGLDRIGSAVVSKLKG